jgi:hypothetical protein
MNRANPEIQHVVRLGVTKSIYSREQNLNQNESVIRRRFVPDSFRALILSRCPTPEKGRESTTGNIPLSLRA